MKHARLVATFIKSAGIFLGIAAVAKLVSSFGRAHIVDYPDPIFLLKNRDVFRILGIIELIVTFFCFLSKNQKMQSGVIALVSSNFLFYRFGVNWLGYEGLCPCLGSMSDVMHISPEVFETALKVTMVYLLIGGVGTSFYLWREREEGKPLHALQR